MTLSAFYIDKFEVTNSTWNGVKAWAAQNGYTGLNDENTGLEKPVAIDGWSHAIVWCNARVLKGRADSMLLHKQRSIDTNTICYTGHKRAYERMREVDNERIPTRYLKRNGKKPLAVDSPAIAIPGAIWPTRRWRVTGQVTAEITGSQWGVTHQMDMEFSMWPETLLS